jgi:integrase
MKISSLQTPSHILKVGSSKLPPTRMTNTPIVLDFVAPPLRVVQISELIYNYLDCKAVNFTPPSYKTMKACAGIFRLVLKDLEMNEDMDTRYLGGTHPKYNLTLPAHYAQVFPENKERLRRAKSLFSRNMCEYYVTCGIEARFFSNWTAHRVAPIGVKAFIPTEEIDRIITKCEEVRFERPNIFKSYLLGYGLGLRRSEMKRVKWSDFYSTLDGNKVIRVWQPKSIKRAKPTDFEDRPTDPTYWDLLQDLRGSAASDALVLDTTKYFLRHFFTTFLKDECGVKETYPIHLLRKYCGHRIMRSDGIYAASKALGHADTKITDRIYSGLPKLKAS